MKICLAGTGAMGEIHVKALAKIDDVQVVKDRWERDVVLFASDWEMRYCAERNPDVKFLDIAD